MTTSEFIIGHSVDDAAERKAELRKIAWALLAALFLHVVIGYFLATFSGLFFSSDTKVEDEDKPVELTMVNVPAEPAVPKEKNSMFMETDESKASKEAPKEKTFESNANSIAASEITAQGNAPLPSQDGKERPNIDLESHSSSLPSEGAQPQPSAPPQETPQPSIFPQSTPTDADQFAMLTSTPKPTPQPTVAQQRQQVRSAYRPMKERTRIAGSISNRGVSAVDALGTPLGRYKKLILDSVGSRWYASVEHNELITIGTLRLVFYIDRRGHVANLKILENSANEAFANVCLDSVQEIKVPPIPDDVAGTLPSEGLEQEITFTNFRN